MEFILEQALLTMVYNQAANGKKKCDYTCGQKVQRDKNFDVNIRICRAQCDVQWDKFYLDQVQKLLQQSPDDAMMQQVGKTKLKYAQKKLQGSMERLAKAKQALRVRLSTPTADLSTRVAKPMAPFVTQD